MYKNRSAQLSFSDEAEFFPGVELDESNRWIRLTYSIPWDEYEKVYADSLSGIGRPAKDLRVALGTYLIKSLYDLTDRDTARLICENPYMQFFLGLPEWSSSLPFSHTSMPRFHKRLPASVKREAMIILKREFTDY